MKLFVDDLRDCPEGWELSRTATQAIRLLAQFPIEEVSLDHDICHTMPGDKRILSPILCEETFEAVAWFIAAMPQEIRPCVKFHTANLDGEKKMRAVLSTFRWPEIAR